MLVEAIVTAMDSNVVRSENLSTGRVTPRTKLSAAGAMMTRARNGLEACGPGGATHRNGSRRQVVALESRRDSIPTAQASHCHGQVPCRRVYAPPRSVGCWLLYKQNANRRRRRHASTTSWRQPAQRRPPPQPPLELRVKKHPLDPLRVALEPQLLVKPHHVGVSKERDVPCQTEARKRCQRSDAERVWARQRRGDG